MSRNDRIAAYEKLTGQTLSGHLGPGPGQDGFVLESSDFTAVKFLDRQDRYQRERDVYLVLSSRRLERIGGHNIPTLVRWIDSLRVLEMTIVVRPFILDFAGAKLPHEIPDFDAEIIEEHHQHLQELFSDRWTDALHVAEMFERETGYTLLDIHPGNIAFADG